MLRIKTSQHSETYDDEREPIYEDITIECEDVPEGAWALITYRRPLPYRRSHTYDEDGNPEPYSFERREIISEAGNEIHLTTVVEGDQHNPTICVRWAEGPFGLMTSTGMTDGYDEWPDTTFFQGARQVKHGILERLVGRAPYMVKETTGCRTRRRWCRLATVAKMVDLTPQQVWDKYQCLHDGECMFCLITDNEQLVAVNHLQPRERPEELRSLKLDHLDLFMGREIPTVSEYIWVRSSWARQILALEELHWPGTKEYQKKATAT
ncbi:hypothetical protein HZA87_04470 [Candidatus Uhrbacteria bacterium]|nr:hypothetical protein [Candidatus Uhrbacteria bacterium]